MGCTYRRGATWWIKFYQNGRPMYESSGSKNEVDAKRLLQLREGDVVRGVPVIPKMGRISFDEAAQDLVTEYDVNARRSLPDVERRIRLHLAPFFRGRRLASITTTHIRQYTRVRQSEGSKNANLNRELAALKRMYTLAIQAGKIVSGPHIPMLSEAGNARTGFFEDSQFEAVRGYLPQYLRGVVTFAFITGWRAPSEILALTWRLIDFAGGTVRLDPGMTKNQEGRVFPFTRELRKLLEAQREYTRSIERSRGVVIPYVFHHDGKRISKFLHAWNTACRRASCPDRVPHDFRRTAVRNLVRAGIPERVAMQMTGHKTRSVFERYNIVSQGDLVDAARRLDTATQERRQRANLER